MVAIFKISRSGYTTFLFFLLIFSSFNIFSQDSPYKLKWGIQLSPAYNFSQWNGISLDNGNTISSKGALTFSARLFYNIYLKNTEQYYYTIRSGISYYPVLYYNAQLREPEVLGWMFYPQDLTTVDFSHEESWLTYFDSMIDINYKINKSSWYLSGGLGFGIVPAKEEFIFELWHNLPNGGRASSIELHSNFSSFPIIGKYGIGISRALYVSGTMNFNVGIQWTQSFNPYLSGDLYLIKDFGEYEQLSIKNYLRQLELNFNVLFL